MQDAKKGSYLCRGEWQRLDEQDVRSKLLRAIKLNAHSEVIIETDTSFSSGSLFWIFLYKICRKRSLALTLPEPYQAWMNAAITENPIVKANTVEALGEGFVSSLQSIRRAIGLTGEISTSFMRLIQGKARFSTDDFVRVLFESGPGALGIVALISFLVGMILAFVGSIQLQTFGAQIFVADLVALAVLREMGAVMAAIIMAGRTGAAFAAELATMKVNDEIAALRVMGINPISYLVLPRQIALTLMVPILAVFADLVGIMGGLFTAVGFMGLSWQEYLAQTKTAVDVIDGVTGVIKAFIFGNLIAFSGCYYGLFAKPTASGVGAAATRSVVMSVVLIVVADSFLTFIFDRLGL